MVYLLSTPALFEVEPLVIRSIYIWTKARPERATTHQSGIYDRFLACFAGIVMLPQTSSSPAEQDDSADMNTHTLNTIVDLCNHQCDMIGKRC